MSFPRLTDDEILAARTAKNQVDPYYPYGYFVEPECSTAGAVEDVATILLTNRHCPFRCLMCDLWRNTTDQRVPLGAIPRQIDHALNQLPATRHVKLYNSGNFFDHQAIPLEDYAAIAQTVDGMQTVIVENHPRLCGDDCLRFRDLLDGQLEVALGLETAHEQVLASLNKRMTTGDFARAVDWLLDHQIRSRAFILLKPPFLAEDEALTWAIRSVEFAFDAGVECCVVIPTRVGNGVMEQLAAAGLFAPPTLQSLERVLEEGLNMDRGRVFVDLWDAQRLDPCPECGPGRRERLRQMNLAQRVLPSVPCACGHSG